MGDLEAGLPLAVWSTMKSLRRGHGTQAAVVSAQTPAGRVRVEASASGEPGPAAIVITAETPSPLPEIPADWPLTTQERVVVRHLAMGKSNVQIAEALFVGEHTVEWHLRGVYEKLGARSRQEVMAALFRQTLLPAIEREVLGRAS